jgi:hypothetical protein
VRHSRTTRAPLAHLPDTGAPLDPLDPQSRIKVLACDAEHEQSQRGQKRGALFWIERRPIPQEPGQLVMSRQRLRGVVGQRRLEVRHELLGAAMHHALPVRELPIRFTLTGLPRRRPKPRLIRINRSLDNPAQKHGGTFQ